MAALRPAPSASASILLHSPPSACAAYILPALPLSHTDPCPSKLPVAFLPPHAIADALFVFLPKKHIHVLLNQIFSHNIFYRYIHLYVRHIIIATSFSGTIGTPLFKKRFHIRRYRTLEIHFLSCRRMLESQCSRMQSLTRTHGKAVLHKLPVFGKSSAL